MMNRLCAMRRLIAMPMVMAASVMAAGCTACVTPATTACTVTPAPVCAPPARPVCPPNTVALDGSVIRNGQVVIDGATARESVRAGKPAVHGKRGKAKESVRVAEAKTPAVKEAASAVKAPAVSKAPAPVAKTAPAPATAQVTVLPPIVAPAINQNGQPLVTVSDVYTITPGQTYTVLPAPTGAAVVSPVEPVAVTAPEALRQQPAGSVRVLGPSTMAITAEEIDNYSKSDVYEIPPEPAPVE